MLYLGRWLPAMPEGCSWGYHWLYWPVRNLWVWSSNIRNFCIINVQYTPWTICHSFAVVRVGLNQLVLPPSQSLAAFQCSEVLDGQPRQCPTTETGQIDLHMWTEDTSLYCRCKKKMAWRVKEEESGGKPCNAFKQLFKPYFIRMTASFASSKASHNLYGIW